MSFKQIDKVDAYTPKIMRSYRWAILSHPWIGYAGVWTTIIYTIILYALLGIAAWMLFLMAGIFYTVWMGAEKNYAGLRKYGNKQWVMGLFAALGLLAVGWGAMGFIFHDHPALIIQDALTAVQNLTIFAILRVADHDDGELEQTIKEKARNYRRSPRLAQEYS